MPATTNNMDFPISNATVKLAPIAQTELSSDPTYTLGQQTTSSYNKHEMRSIDVPLVCSEMPGPEFSATASSSSYRAGTVKPRSKTPTAYELSCNTLQNRLEKK